MIVLGALLLILGFVFAVHLLTVLGVVLLVVGAVMWAMGSIGRPVAGRRHYY
jgi:drug/metabolite transporter (DMT)-like permease